jgi:uncharacterized protein
MVFHVLTRSLRVIVLTFACVAFVGVARSQQPSPAAIATAKELIEIKGALNIFEALVPGVIEQTKNLFLQTSPNLSKDLNEVAAQLRAELAPRRAELTEQVALLYAQRFTEQELKSTLLFYKSPLGKKLAAEEPGFVDQSLRFAQDWANKLSEEVVGKMRMEMKKKGHDL